MLLYICSLDNNYHYTCRVHAICICDDAAVFHKDIDTILGKLGLSEDSEGRHAVQSKDIIDIIDGYKGHGNYGPSTDEELGIDSPSELVIALIFNKLLCLFTAQLLEISSQTGIILDPVYTLKAVRGMLAELKKNPQRFKGNRILYIHTGAYILCSHHKKKAQKIYNIMPLLFFL